MTLAVLFAGCNVAPPETQCVRSAIVGGVPATLYPEAVVLSMSQHGFVTGECSGALIAPQVVLTAGHCVAAYTAWDVRAAFASQSSSSSAGETFDWKDDGTDQVTGDRHDVGLLFLDTAITLTTYPVVASTAVADGSSIVNIGRIHDGTVSGSSYLSNPLAVTKADGVGFPYDYFTSRVIEVGDSGGPVEVPGATPHAIVAINSGVNGDRELLARVDLLSSWIQDRIAAHGGNGASQAPASPATPPTTTAGCP